MTFASVWDCNRVEVFLNKMKNKKWSLLLDIRKVSCSLSFSRLYCLPIYYSSNFLPGKHDLITNPLELPQSRIKIQLHKIMEEK